MREPPGIEGSEAKRGDRLGAGPQRVHLFDLEQLPAESLDCDEAPPSDAGADAGVESRATQQSRQDLCHLKSRSSASEVREGPPESRASWPADAQMHATGAEPRGQEASQEPQQQKHSTGAPASPPLAGRVGAAAGKKSKQAVGSSKRPKRSGFMSPHGVGVGVGEGVEGWEAREGPLFRSYAQAPPVMVGRSLGPEMKEAIMRLDREMQQQEQAGWEQKRHMAAAAAAGDAPLRLSGRYGGNGAQAAQGGLPSTVPQTSGMQSSDRTWASSEGAKGMVTAGVKQDQLVPSDGRAHPHAHRRARGDAQHYSLEQPHGGAAAAMERAMWQWAHALRSTQGGGAHFPPPAHLVEFGAAAHVAIPPAARAPFKRPPPLVLMQDGTTREKTQEEQEQQQRAAQSGSSSSNDDQARATSARSAAPGGGGGKLKGRGRGAAAASRAAAAAGAAPRGAAAGSVGGGGRGQRTGGGAKAATGKGQLGGAAAAAGKLRDGEPRAAPPGGGPGGEDNEDASSACSGEGVVNPPFECVEAVPGGPHGEVALHQHPAARGGAAEGQVAGGKCATSKLAEERVKHASERADGLTRSSSRTKSPGAAQRGKQGAPCGGPSRPRQTLPQDARARGGGVGVCEGALALREVPGVFAGQQVALTGAHGEELRQKSIQAVMGPSELSDDSEEVQGRQVAAPAASSSPSNLGLGAATLGFRSHAAGGPPGGADEDVHVAAAEEPAEDKAASRARQVSAVFAAAADGAADKNASRAPCQVPAASGAGAACARLPLLQASTRGEAEMGEDLKLQSKADPSEGGEGGGGGGGGQVGEDVLPGGKHVQLLRLPGVKSMSPLRGAAEGSLKYRLLKRTSTCPRVPAGDNDMQQLPALVFHAAHKAMSAPAMNSPASLIQSLSLMSPGGGPKEINAGACRAYARVSKVSPEVSNVDAEASTEGGGEGGGGGGGGADVAASRARCDTGKAAATSARQLDDFEMQTLELQRLLR
eukprot:jgi/Mesen1/787/ME000110S_11055